MGSWVIKWGTAYRVWLLLLVFFVSACAPAATLNPVQPTLASEPLPGSEQRLPSEENEPDWGAASAFPDYEFGRPETAADPDSPPGSSRVPDREAPFPVRGNDVTTPAADLDPEEDRTDRPPEVETSRIVSPAPLDPPPVLPPGSFYSVQLLVSSTRGLADDWKARAEGLFEEDVRLDFEDDLYKLRVGVISTEEGADALRRQAVGLGYADARVVRMPARGETR